MNPQKIVIFGQYKTGTTGLFTTIRNSLPSETRTLFEPLGYIPEASDNQRWVLAKTIIKEPEHPEPVDYASFMGFERRLCITRDPRDWLISATLFNCQLKESIFANHEAMAWVMDYLQRKEDSPHSLPLITLLEYILSAPPALSIEDFGNRAQRRHAFCTDFQNRLGHNVCPVRYEDFVDGHLGAIEDYLGFQLPEHSQVDMAYSHVPRTCAYGNWKDWLTEEDTAFFKPFFADYIHDHGYDPDWSVNSSPTIDPAHCSQYVSRVVQMKKEQLACE